jgi:hypothetical protein
MSDSRQGFDVTVTRRPAPGPTAFQVPSSRSRPEIEPALLNRYHETFRTLIGLAADAERLTTTVRPEDLALVIGDEWETDEPTVRRFVAWLGRVLAAREGDAR